MKKKILIVVSIIILLLVIILLVLNINKKSLNKINYRIEVSLVDDYSPDRILTIYNNENEKVEVKRIEYLDGTLLCNGYNTVVHFGDIEDEKEFILVLKDDSKEKAKIVEKEVEK